MSGRLDTDRQARAKPTQYSEPEYEFDFEDPEDDPEELPG